jgi:hypothetical protein
MVEPPGSERTPEGFERGRLTQDVRERHRRAPYHVRAALGSGSSAA